MFWISTLVSTNFMVSATSNFNEDEKPHNPVTHESFTKNSLL